MKIIFRLSYIAIGIVFCFVITSCKKLVEVDAPDTSINEGNVYQTDINAISVLSAIYINFSNEDVNIRYIGNGFPMMNYLPALSADELTLLGSNSEQLTSYYKNELSTITVGGDNFWSRGYYYIYAANGALSGLSNSKSLTPSIKNQLLGEAYFIRAFCYFYLVNLYGKLPLATSTDYKINALLPRAEVSDVYELIKSDLIKAQDLLSDQFKDGTLLNSTDERIRPNKGAATALLARAYLYTAEWSRAEIESSKIINNTSLYSPVALGEVFKKNSKETIWALQPMGVTQLSNTGSGRLFILPDNGVDGFNYPVYLSDALLNSFEYNDPRKDSWINSAASGGNQYAYAYKYKIGDIPAATEEYPIILRLAEQYLIRSEARARQNNIIGAVEDLNVIRKRARGNGTTTVLPDLLLTINQDQVLSAVMHERQVELFTEWGHRWLDLKRTGEIDAVMQNETRLKGGTWVRSQSLYPIPASEILNNPNLVQNPGYE
jgi:starch-binding outer membrane protein, SusD/RagB family